VLQCVAVCCSVLQCVRIFRGERHFATENFRCVAVYCSMLQYVAGCCRVLQGVAVCCRVYLFFEASNVLRQNTFGVLQRVAACRSVLQCVRCVVVYCIVYLFSEASGVFRLSAVAPHCNTLQHTVSCCNILQHLATHCNILQHTVYLFSEPSDVLRLSALTSCVTVCNNKNTNIVNCGHK